MTLSIDTQSMLKIAIKRMIDGDIRAFMETRRLMDDLDFLELSERIDEKSFSAYFIGRCILEQVISNLAADSMFEFPPEGTPLEKHFRKLSSCTGLFLQELIFSDTKNYVKGIEHLTNAISLYYEYLRVINKAGQQSNLGNHNVIWQLEQ